MKLSRKFIKLTIKIAIYQSGITPLLRSFLRLRRTLWLRWGDPPATASVVGYNFVAQAYSHIDPPQGMDGTPIPNSYRHGLSFLESL